MSAYAYLIGWRIVRFLPESLAYKLFLAIGNYVYKKNGKGVQRLRNNMRKVSGLDGSALEELTADAMRSYMRYWCDTFRLPDWTSEKIAKDVELVNGHFLTDPLDAGKGVVS